MRQLSTYLFGTALIAVTPGAGAAVVFDFGNANTGNNSQNGGDGNWTPFANETTDVSTTASTTISGLEMTLVGTAVDGNATSDDYWGINNQGIGIITDDTTNGLGASVDRRIDGSLGEAVSFSFDQDVFLVSMRLGSFAGNANSSETVSLTPDGGAAIVFDKASTTTAPTTDLSLGNVLVTAGTNITLTTTQPVGSGVLFNEITVEVVPEPASLALLGLGGLLLARRRRG